MKDSPTPPKHTEAEFDSYTDNYEALVDGAVGSKRFGVDFAADVKARYLVKLLRPLVPEGRKLKLLDIGCGVGLIHKYLNLDWLEITGADVSERSVVEARTRHVGNRYVALDGKSLPFNDGEFDAAVTICVMHHVPPAQWNGFVGDARRVVRRGGLFAVFEHNPLNPLTRRIVSNCEFDKDAVLLWPRNLKAMLTKGGFDKVTSKSILTVPPQGTLLSKVDHLAGHLPFGAQYCAWGQ